MLCELTQLASVNLMYSTSKSFKVIERKTVNAHNLALIDWCGEKPFGHLVFCNGWTFRCI